MMHLQAVFKWVFASETKYFSKKKTSSETLFLDICLLKIQIYKSFNDLTIPSLKFSKNLLNP